MTSPCCLCVHLQQCQNKLPFPDNGSLNTFRLQWTHTQHQKTLDTVLSVRFLQYQILNKKRKQTRRLVLPRTCCSVAAFLLFSFCRRGEQPQLKQMRAYCTLSSVQQNRTPFLEKGPKKCTHSLIVNIFGTKWHVVTILARREGESLYVFEVTTISGQTASIPPRCWANYGCQCVWCNSCTWRFDGFSSPRERVDLQEPSTHNCCS
jgi:hypothetical protein